MTPSKRTPPSSRLGKAVATSLLGVTLAAGCGVDRSRASSLEIPSDTALEPGFELVGGDMIVPSGGTEGGTDAVETEGGRRISAKKAASSWPSGVIPYVIDGSALQFKANIQKAIQTYKQQTQVRLVPRKKETAYVEFTYTKGISSSYIGRMGYKQLLHLSRTGGRNVYVILHEIGHALGFQHEHQRPDRDQFITLQLQNANAGTEKNFTLIPADATRLMSPYDYDSIMHYDSREFSKNRQPVMLRKDGTEITGFKSGKFSAQDIAAIQRIVDESRR